MEKLHPVLLRIFRIRMGIDWVRLVHKYRKNPMSLKEKLWNFLLLPSQTRTKLVKVQDLLVEVVSKSTTTHPSHKKIHAQTYKYQLIP
jgi:hypothetical protein